jgi:hypothetical protein
MIWLATFCRRWSVLLLKVAQHLDPLPVTAEHARAQRLLLTRNLYAGLHIVTPIEDTKGK